MTSWCPVPQPITSNCDPISAKHWDTMTPGHTNQFYLDIVKKPLKTTKYPPQHPFCPGYNFLKTCTHSRLWWMHFCLMEMACLQSPAVAGSCQLCCNFKAQLMVLYSTKINDDALSTFFFHPSSQHCHAVQCAMHSWTVGKRLNPYIHCYLTSLSTLTVLEKNGLSTLLYFPLC